MVVLFPGAKDQTWRWQTSNADYGKFYLALSSEALGLRCRQQELHAECNKKCEALSRQLYELRAELERLRIGGRLHSPRSDKPGCRSPTNHNGDCDYAAKTRMPCDDMYHTTHDIDYNGGGRSEPQILEDHLRADHPRLVKKVQPVNPVGTSCFQKESGSEQKIYGHGPPSIYWTKGGATPDEEMHMQRQQPPAGSAGSGTVDSVPVRQHFGNRTPESGGGSYGSAGNRVPGSPRALDTPPRVRQAPPRHETPPPARDTASEAGATMTTRKFVHKATTKVANKTPRSATAPKERTGGGAVSGGGGYRGGGEGSGNRNYYSGGGSGGGDGGSYPASQGGSESRYAASRERDIPLYVPHESLKSSGPQKKILPPSQRYNFYRYYGFAGQGAKTSRGWNPK